MSVALQQLMARFLGDEAFERRVRTDAESLAKEEGVALEAVQRLAAISEARVAAFRRSRAHKDSLRGGAGPSKLGW